MPETVEVVHIIRKQCQSEEWEIYREYPEGRRCIEPVAVTLIRWKDRVFAVERPGTLKNGIDLDTGAEVELRVK